jgi:predicted DNA-binding antitoxin AbrB/MazE fold protein
MCTHVEAGFENGIFRPLQPIQLAEHQRVTVIIDEKSADSVDQVQFVLSNDRWQSFCDALDAPPKEIPALRKLLTEPSLFDGNRNAAS